MLNCIFMFGVIFVEYIVLFLFSLIFKSFVDMLCIVVKYVLLINYMFVDYIVLKVLVFVGIF